MERGIGSIYDLLSRNQLSWLDYLSGPIQLILGLLEVIRKLVLM